ncbi:unnamed protein product, partial [Ectocarpus sp. 12 AP-2014]
RSQAKPDLLVPLHATPSAARAAYASGALHQCHSCHATGQRNDSEKTSPHTRTVQSAETSRLYVEVLTPTLCNNALRSEGSGVCPHYRKHFVVKPKKCASPPY